MNIDGSVALVTGANRGLGAAYVDALLDRGAAKVYAAVRDVTSVTDSRVIPVRLDVTDRASIAEAVKTAPDVTLLINNAGVHTHTPTLGDEAGLREELEVNYLGPVAVSRAFTPVLGANDGGAMINMLSGLAWFTLPTRRRRPRSLPGRPSTASRPASTRCSSISSHGMCAARCRGR